MISLGELLIVMPTIPQSIQTFFNDLLDGKTPLALIAQGKWQLVADYVADMITGRTRGRGVLR